MCVLLQYNRRCGHCKRLEPEWKNAARELKGKVKFGIVDATISPNLAQQFGVCIHISYSYNSVVLYIEQHFLYVNYIYACYFILKNVYV